MASLPTHHRVQITATKDGKEIYSKEHQVPLCIETVDARRSVFAINEQAMQEAVVRLRNELRDSLCS